MMEPIHPVPTLDFRTLSGSHQDRLGWCELFVEALRTHGWVCVDNHPLCRDNAIEDLFELVRVLPIPRDIDLSMTKVSGNAD